MHVQASINKAAIVRRTKVCIMSDSIIFDYAALCDGDISTNCLPSRYRLVQSKPPSKDVDKLLPDKQVRVVDRKMMRNKTSEASDQPLSGSNSAFTTPNPSLKTNKVKVDRSGKPTGSSHYNYDVIKASINAELSNDLRQGKKKSLSEPR
jgi:hypothetical protein